MKDQIKKFLKGEVLNDKETLKQYSHDASLFEVKPDMIVFPKDIDDIKNLVLFAGENTASHVSLTARSGGTDMTGGPLNNSIIIDFTKHFNHIKEVKDGHAVAEPGVFYRDFEKETLKRNLLMPSYPASRSICAIGGMVANNSGGEKTLSYGKTEKYVAELKVILKDGKEYTIKPLTKTELDEKISQDDFEGKIYRDLYALIEDNSSAIKLAKPNVSKNSSGYALWNVWNGEIFDLTKLFVGSQGTLGIITEIKFKLIKPKKYSKLLVIFLKDFKLLAQVVGRVLRQSPESFESFDDHALRLGIRYLFFRFAFQFLPELWMVLTSGLPKLVLLAEFTGDSPEEVVEKVLKAQSELKDLNLKTRITKNISDAEKYWTVRRESFNLLRTKIKGKKTAPFIDDIIVRPETLPEFLPRLEEVRGQYKIIYTIAGHVGDGNFHIIPLMNFDDPQTKVIISELSDRVYKLVFQFHGSMTAEHNDGLIRTPYLKEMFGDHVYEIFVKVKNIFDPDNIFNPGKKVGEQKQ